MQKKNNTDSTNNTKTEMKKRVKDFVEESFQDGERVKTSKGSYSSKYTKKFKSLDERIKKLEELNKDQAFAIKTYLGEIFFLDLQVNALTRILQEKGVVNYIRLTEKECVDYENSIFKAITLPNLEKMIPLPVLARLPRLEENQEEEKKEESQKENLISDIDFELSNDEFSVENLLADSYNE